MRIAPASHQVPGAVPPLQVPLLDPGTLVHRKASTWVNPVVVVVRGPIPRRGALQGPQRPGSWGGG